MLSGGAVGRTMIRTDHENRIGPVKAARTKASAATKRLDAKVTGRPQSTGLKQSESHSYNFLSLVSIMIIFLVAALKTSRIVFVFPLRLNPNNQGPTCRE